MLSPKRIKLSTTEKQNEISTESGFCSGFGDSTSDFTLPMVKRKAFSSRRSSNIQKQSFDSLDIQQTSDYSSLLSLTTGSSSVRRSGSLTPKKRKHDVTASDENFYNSHSFVSPLKIPKQDLSHKRAKLILKEKSSSENVILSSTPIQNNNKRWGKFRSFHPEKFEIGKSLDVENEFEEQMRKLPNLPKFKNSETSSFDCSSFDLTNGSFNLTSSISNEHKKHDIPEGHFKESITNIEQITTNPKETITKPQEQTAAATSFSFKTARSSRNYCGKNKLNIMGKLYTENNFPVNLILSYLNGADLHSFSHVSKEYRDIIRSNKTYEKKRHIYLKAHLDIKENQFPSAKPLILVTPQIAPVASSSKGLKVLASCNTNLLTMQLRPKPKSPPVSPSKRRFYDNQKVARSHKGPLKKCPRCSKPATINIFKIRSSPRKRKSNSFLTTKSYTDAHLESNKIFVSISEDNRSSSPSNSCGSPSASDDSSGSGSEMPTDGKDEIYEYGSCSGILCKYKFCIKCNCKSHPRTKCADLSPASPSKIINTSIACTKKSLKSLKRLVY